MSLRRHAEPLTIDKLKLIMANHMLKFFLNFFVTAATCLALAALDSSAARSDELPDADSRSDATLRNIPLRSTSEDLPTDVTQRQHVRHLRAHKKFSIDTPSDLTQPTDKSENAQNPDAKRAYVAAGAKVDADGQQRRTRRKLSLNNAASKSFDPGRGSMKKRNPFRARAPGLSSNEIFSRIFLGVMIER